MMEGYLVVRQCEKYRGLARTPEWGPENFLSDTFEAVAELVNEEWLSPTLGAAVRAKHLLSELFSQRLEIIWVADDANSKLRGMDWTHAGFDLATHAPYESGLYPEPLTTGPFNSFGLLPSSETAEMVLLGLRSSLESNLNVWSVYLEGQE
jgi:hypothetical protein